VATADHELRGRGKAEKGEGSLFIIQNIPNLYPYVTSSAKI
jgi:hypothetical protein